MDGISGNGVIGVIAIVRGGTGFIPKTSRTKQELEFYAPTSFEEGLRWTIELLLAFKPISILRSRRVLCT